MLAGLNEKALAIRWGISVRTLQRWRQEGTGPDYLKMGGRIVYWVNDILAFEERCRRRSTAPEQGD